MDELNLITNERAIDYTSLDELTYQWKGDMVELFINDFYEGDCEVYFDYEQDAEGREYIGINYEVIYLCGIKEKC